MGKNKKGQPPHVEVAVALLMREGKILVIFNPKWEAFTLPMTKRRRWADPETPDDPEQDHEEDWADAAGRTAVECVRKVVRFDNLPLDEITDFEYSGRTGEWKHYRIQVFDAKLSPPVETAEGLLVDWLTPDDFLDASRRPISPTAREIVRLLRAHNRL